MKELILHRCHLVNADGIAQALKLRKLILVGCSFDNDSLSVLSKASGIKELGLNEMSVKELSALKGMKSLKTLRLRQVTDFDTGELAEFTGLWELELNHTEKYQGEFLGKLKKLKKLDLHYGIIADLDFLSSLTNLTEFHLAKPAIDESGLLAVCGLSKLKRFIYPVKDLSVYKGHSALEGIGMATGVTHGFDVFEGSKVNHFTVVGKVTHEELEEIKKQMERYVKIYTYMSEFSEVRTVVPFY